ncbi:hypothetical protein THAOC_05443, partial [Thalassiosira oceanica]
LCSAANFEPEVNDPHVEGPPTTTGMSILQALNELPTLELKQTNNLFWCADEEEVVEPVDENLELLADVLSAELPPPTSILDDFDAPYLLLGYIHPSATMQSPMVFGLNEVLAGTGTDESTSILPAEDDP